MGTFIRIVASFATVGVLLWIFARASRGRLGHLLSGSVKGTKAEPISILDRRQLSRSNAVAIIRAGSRHLLVGVGESGVQLLAEGDDLVADIDTDDAAETKSHHPAPKRVGLRATANDEDGPTPNDLVLSQRLDPVSVGSTATDRGGAWTRLHRATEPSPPRTSVIEVLRARTVRRS